MRNLLSIFQGNNKETGITKKIGILTHPGDRLEARVTKSNRNVLKIHQNNGSLKYSATQYPNGTIVETRVTKKK